MKVPPKKPHFFKPILPGFKNGLKIPIGFFKYLKGHDQYKHAILRRAGKKWLVKVNGQRLEDGNWKEFVEQHDLQLGDILVFKHEGDMEFKVSIFHSSHCEREYAEHLQEEKDEDKEAVTHDKSFGQSHCECIIRQYSLLRGFMCLPQQFIKMNGLTNKKCGLIVRDERQRSWNLKLSSNNTRAYIGDGWCKFIAENCLKEGDRIIFEIVPNGETPIWKFQVITDGEPPVRKFQDERQRSWNLKLSSNNTRAYIIGDGWRKFIAENCLKEGDCIMFEIVTNGKTPIWKFRVVTDGETAVRMSQEKPSPSIELSNKASSHAEAATNTPFVQSHFECSITPYWLSRDLHLPKQFVFANGLIDKKCDLIIRDERQRSWSLKLRYWRTEIYIRNGSWRKFSADNSLKEGDRIKFEVVSNGDTPIWKYQVADAETPLQKFQDIMKKPSDMNPLNAQVSTSTPGDDDHPYFVSTIKPYCFSKPVLSNGLIDRKCEMILKDEAQRCWSVWLGRLSHHFGIISGWTKFRVANGLQVGDSYKFELIKNGEIPIAHFHCKYSGMVAKRGES